MRWEKEHTTREEERSKKPPSHPGQGAGNAHGALFVGLWSMGILILLLVLLFIRPGAAQDNLFDHARLLIGDNGYDGPLAGEWRHLPGLVVADSPLWEQAPLSPVPSTWKEHFGAASYQLEIIGLAGSEWGVCIPYQGTAYELFLNDTLISSNGRVATEKSLSKAQYHPHLIRLVPVTGDDVITLAVSNFHHRRGGPFQPLRLGPYESLVHKNTWHLVADWVFVAIFMAMASYQAVYGLARTHRSSIWLALLFFSLVLNGLTGTAEVLLLRMAPTLSWEFFQKLCYWSSYSVPIWLLLFFNDSLHYLSPRQKHITLIPFILILLTVLITPAHIFTRANIVFQLLTLALISFILGALIDRSIRKVPTARSLLAGNTIFCGIIISSILFSHSRIGGGTYLPLGFLSGSTIALWGGASIPADALSFILIFLLIGFFSFSQLRAEEAKQLYAIPPPLHGQSYGLSGREEEIAHLLLQGMSNVEIAERLNISRNTVKTHVANILAKTGATRRSALHLKLMAQREIPP